MLNPPSGLTGYLVNNLVTLDVVEKETHYWSPHLTFRVEADEDDPTKTVLSGLIGPKPSVWTMFMFIYFSAGALGFIISSFGVAKYTTGIYSHSLWAFPVAILFMLTAYQAGKYGEQLGADQIETMKHFIRDIIDNK